MRDGSMVEKLSFEVETPRIKSSGLKLLLSDLRAIDTVLSSIRSKFETVTFKKTATDLKKELANFRGATKVSASSPMEIGKFLGFDERHIERFFGKLNAKRAGYFNSTKQAAERFAKLSSSLAKEVNVGPAAMAAFMTGQAGGKIPGKLPTGKVRAVGEAMVDGPIMLKVPASQVVAVLEGAVNLTIPPGAVQGTVAGGGGPAGGGSKAAPGKGKAEAAGGVPEASLTAKEIERRVRQTRKGTTTSITRALAPFETETETTGPKGDKSIERRSQSGKRLVDEVNQKLRKEEMRLKAEVAKSFSGDKAADLRSRSRLLTKAAKGLEALDSAYGKDLRGIFQPGVADKITERAAKLKSEAAQLLVRAADEEKKAAAKELRERSRAGKEMDRVLKTGERTRKKNQQDSERADREAEKNRAALRAEQAAVFKGAKGRSILDAAAAEGFNIKEVRRGEFIRRGKDMSSTTTVLERDKDGKRETRRVMQEYDSRGELVNTKLGVKETSTPPPRKPPGSKDFVTNTEQVTRWAASVAVLYGTLNLAQTSLSGLIDTGLQTARLEQVFSGIGGSARELRDDVFELAAANGRTSKEALDSTIAWSRLGMTRKQVNEAVKVSLMAANVAELEAGEATKKLIAIYTAYQLRVTELNGVLGMLNQTSNTYNVTNADLLEGIARTAGVARQAGLSLAQLIGLVGSTVGATGQTGANIGNAVKAIIVQLSNPEIQKFLRNQFKLELTAEGGAELREMGDILADLYVRYQDMTNAERQLLLVRVAGRHQASRMASMLDNYIRAQTLAVAAQLNLNSAELENAKIKATLSAQLKGIAAEWDRFIAKQGDKGVSQGMVAVAQAFRNVLALMNTDTGSNAITGMVVLMTVLGARLFITTMQMKAMRGEATFLGASLGKTAAMLRTLNAAMVETAARGPLLVGLFKSLRGAMTFAGAMGALARVAGFVGTMIKAIAVALVDFLPILLAVGAATWLFNKGMEALGQSSEGAEKKLASFTLEAERAAKAAEGAGDAAKLFDTLGRAWPDMTREKRFQSVKDLTDSKLVTPQVGKELKQAVQNNDMARAAVLLEQAKVMWIQRAADEREKEAKSIEQNLRTVEAEIQRLQQSPFANKDKIKEKEKDREDLKRQVTGKLMRDVLGVDRALEQWLDTDLKHQTSLEKQRMLLESIAEIYRSLPAATPQDRYFADLAAAEAKLSFLQAQKDGLEKQKPKRRSMYEPPEVVAAPPESERDRQRREETLARELKRRAETGLRRPGGVRSLSPQERQAEEARAGKNADDKRRLDLLRETEEKIKEQQKQVEALRAMEAEARRQTRYELAAKSASYQAQQFDVGTNEGERLKNRERGLNKLIGDRQRELKSQNDPVKEQNLIVETLQLQLELHDTILEKERRRFQLSRDELNLMKEKQKELQRTLLMAGPGELLKQMAAFQIGRKGVSAGQWFALSPEMREALMKQHPQLSPEMRDIRKERGELGAPIGTKGMQEIIDRLTNERNALLKRLERFNPKPAGIGPEAEAVARATAETNRFTAGLAAARTQLDKLTGSVSSLIERIGGGEGPGRGAGGGNLPQGRGLAIGLA